MAKTLISLIITAYLCGIIPDLVQTTALHQILKMICGLVLTISILGVLRNVDLTFPELIPGESAQRYINEGEAISKDAMAAIIKTKAEAYILDKAAEENAEITVTISLDDGEPPLPESAVIGGSLSAKGKRTLEAVFFEQLGIAKEKLTWIGIP